MDGALLNFLLYLLLIAGCSLVSRWLPPLLHLGERHEHPWVAVRGGRDLLNEDIELPSSESKLPRTS